MGVKVRLFEANLDLGFLVVGALELVIIRLSAVLIHSEVVFTATSFENIAILCYELGLLGLLFGGFRSELLFSLGLLLSIVFDLEWPLEELGQPAEFTLVVKRIYRGFLHPEKFLEGRDIVGVFLSSLFQSLGCLHAPW